MIATRRLVIILLSVIALFFLCDFTIYKFMRHGIDNYFGLNQKSQILLIGHSHLMLGVDKSRMEKELGMKISKYCREGVNVVDKKNMVYHFLNAKNADSLKYVLYGVDLFSFTGDGLSRNSYKLFYPFMDEDAFEEYIYDNSSFSDYLLHKFVRTSRFNDDAVKNSAFRGWMNNWSNYKTNIIDIESYRKILTNGDERRISMNDSLIADFEETIKFITDKEINVILVNTPTIDLLNTYEPLKYRRMMQWFSDFAEKHPLVEFVDFNPKYEANYQIFSDKIHLNRNGQKAITSELINLLKQKI